MGMNYRPVVYNLLLGPPCGQHQIPSTANWKAREVDGFDVLCVCLFTFVMVCAVLSVFCFLVLLLLWVF